MQLLWAPGEASASLPHSVHLAKSLNLSERQLQTILSGLVRMDGERKFS